MTTAYRSIFDSADWIAALDRQLAAPPEPPADEPIIAETPPYATRPTDEPLPTWDTQPAATRRRVRNWQVAIVYAMIHTALVTAVVMLATASTALGLLSLAIHGAALLIALAVGIPFTWRRHL